MSKYCTISFQNTQQLQLNNNHYVLLLHSECLFHKMSHNSRKTEDGLHELSEFELAEFKQAFREFDKDPIFGSIDQK